MPNRPGERSSAISVVRGAIRPLRRNPPLPARKLCMVHGDYRNFLYDREGHILRILQWAMTHPGDPLEDIVWCCDPLWNHFNNAKVAGTIPEGEGIPIWELKGGLRADWPPGWWKLLSAEKVQAIWTTAGNEFAAYPSISRSS
jgi:aminoglycoside phosphotransferase (APT) family kinase protein